MPIVKDSQRKNAFSHRLKDKPKQLPEPKPEMTADEMKVAEKAYRDSQSIRYDPRSIGDTSRDHQRMVA